MNPKSHTCRKILSPIININEQRTVKDLSTFPLTTVCYNPSKYLIIVAGNVASLYPQLYIVTVNLEQKVGNTR